jgi:hypothetical protein
LESHPAQAGADAYFAAAAHRLDQALGQGRIRAAAVPATLHHQITRTRQQ